MQSKYEVLGIVGEGAYGKVFKCKNKQNSEYVAMKQFKEVDDDQVKKTMSRELKVLQMLKHDNIVEFKEAFKRKGNLYLVFEYVEKNLLEFLQEHPKGLDPSIIKKIIYQTCLSIKYLHDMNIIHRDIKPENLLIHDNLKLKLCDFGFARTLKSNKEKLTDYVATRWYRSPELLLSDGFYGPEVDYWAIGCIMGELTDGDPLFDGSNEIDQILVIQRILGKLPDSQIELFYNNPHFKGIKLPEFLKPETLERRYMGKLSKQALSFMKGLLSMDPKTRLKGDAIFSHPYFENYSNPFSVKNIGELNFCNEEKLKNINDEKNKINSIVIKKNEVGINKNSLNLNSSCGIVTNNNINNILGSINTEINSVININETKQFSLNCNSNGNIETTNYNSGEILNRNYFNQILNNTNNKTKENLKNSNSLQPIINNTTNINIINYNSFEHNNNFGITEKNIYKNNIKHNNKVNKKNSFNEIINKENIQKKLKNNKFSTNSGSTNMIMTSYNFNQNLKENLSMYSSTTFDNNFKTFYKGEGDPYNFDIETNFVNKNKLNENHHQKKLSSDIPGCFFEDDKINKLNNFCSKNNLQNNKKKITFNEKPKLKSNINVIYEESYNSNNKKLVSKLNSNPVVNVSQLKNGHLKEFQLPSINNKGFLVKKNFK